MYRILLLDGHECHISAEFDKYCEDNKIISLSLPPHSSLLTQNIDVGYFSPLRRAYGKEISAFIMASITHITKEEFLIAFKASYFEAVTANNIQGGF